MQVLLRSAMTQETHARFIETSIKLGVRVLPMQDRDASRTRLRVRADTAHGRIRAAYVGCLADQSCAPVMTQVGCGVLCAGGCGGELGAPPALPLRLGLLGPPPCPASGPVA